MHVDEVRSVLWITHCGLAVQSGRNVINPIIPFAPVPLDSHADSTLRKSTTFAQGEAYNVHNDATR